MKTMPRALVFADRSMPVSERQRTGSFWPILLKMGQILVMGTGCLFLCLAFVLFIPVRIVKELVNGNARGAFDVIRRLY